MFAPLFSFLSTLRSWFRSRAAVHAEILALRHQLLVLQRSSREHRLRLHVWDRAFWVWLSRLWPGWRSALLIVKPETVIAWHRKGFRLFWTWKARRGQPGRPVLSREIRDLIRQMSRENPGWGAPRIHGELLVLAHDRRRILHFNVTAHPTAAWTGQQLREAFPFDQLPRYLLRDRDTIFGEEFRRQVRDMGIHEVLSTPRSPWQRAYVERVIGSIRRECLDHGIVFQETSLRRILGSYFDYYHRSRTHLSSRKDSPEPRSVQPPEMGAVAAVSQVGGLHHRYERRAA
jgi:hypothetical protein